VPDYLQKDLFNKSERTSRSRPIEDRGLDEDGILLFPDSGGPFNNNDSEGLSLLDNLDKNNIDESSTDSFKLDTNSTDEDIIFGRFFSRLLDDGGSSTILDGYYLNTNNDLINESKENKFLNCLEVVGSWIGNFILENGGLYYMESSSSSNASIAMNLRLFSNEVNNKKYLRL